MSVTRSLHSSALVIHRTHYIHWLYAALLTGLLVWLGHYPAAALIFGLTAAVSLGVTKLELDVPGRQFRLGIHVFGLAFCRWQPLPAAQRVVIRYFSKLTIDNEDGAEQRNVEYIVLLSVPNSTQGVVLFRCPTYKMALRIACYVGAALQVEVVSFNQYKQEAVVQEVLEAE
ncbi:hypothetical protein [Hymenobacter persicinus]|uniref:Uncharacterized protein n=1 Tax=Hymenobacter persicinus TaxID=2025506 RepID=A0A4Q5L7N3_9BACT|nr:hypothetical protein [Hymenobacter persicinus]RYU77179.1 hypothetical protein EWM57_17870 [Hymenobacter persicinus]